MWHEVPPAGSEPQRWWTGFIGPVLMAALLWVIGWHELAIVVLLVGLAVTLAVLWSPPIRRGLSRVFAAVGHGVGLVLGVVLLGLVEVFVIFPIALVARIWPGKGPFERFGWRGRPASTEERRRPFGIEVERAEAGPPSALRRVLGFVPLTVGFLVLALVVDVALGTAWDAWADDDPQEQTSLAEASSSPAMRDYPWREAYFETVADLEYAYEPYLYPRLRDVASDHVNSEDGVRDSYQPSTAEDVPVVWFFGGSTTWGLGQRDDHTIPSEVARLAEEEGRPIEVVNFGGRGYTSWQDMQVFERALAHRDAPDLAVFLEGINDHDVQVEYPSPDPEHFDVARIHEDLTGQPIGQVPDFGAVTAPSEASLWDEYRDVSAVAEVVDGVRSVVGTAHAGSGADDDVEAYTVEVYERSRSVSEGLAARDGVETLFVWEPWQDRPDTYRAAASAVGDPTVDLSGVLDDAPGTLSFDGRHVNESGARLVAAAVWAELAPVVADPE